MTATAQDVATSVTEIQAIANEILTTIEAAAPGDAVPAGVAQALLNLASAAIVAWTTASGTPVTVESLRALLPNPAPLTPPTS